MSFYNVNNLVFICPHFESLIATSSSFIRNPIRFPPVQAPHRFHNSIHQYYCFCPFLASKSLWGHLSLTFMYKSVLMFVITDNSRDLVCDSPNNCGLRCNLCKLNKIKPDITASLAEYSAKYYNCAKDNA